MHKVAFPYCYLLCIGNCGSRFSNWTTSIFLTRLLYADLATLCKSTHSQLFTFQPLLFSFGCFSALCYYCGIKEIIILINSLRCRNYWLLQVAEGTHLVLLQVFTTPSIPLVGDRPPCGRVLNPLPSPRPFQKGKGCNRSSSSLGTATL